MARFCPNCGSPLQPTDTKCNGCGANITPDAVETKTYTAPQYATNEPQPPVAPKTYLVESILVTLFCCLPFGIAGIVYASKVDGLYNSKRYAEAQEASNNAKKWMKWGLISGAIILILYTIFMVAGIASLPFMLSDL